MIRLLISFVQWALRIPLLVAGALGLIAFLHLVSKQGNVFLLYDEKIRNIPFLLESTEQWIPFLGGEFAFSVVLPLAVHLVLASSDGGRSLSTFFVLSILAGLWIAHGVAFRFAKSGEEMMLLIDNQKHINKLMAVAALYCIFDRKSQKPRINLNAPVWLFVLVKAVGILLIVTAVFVISMGTSAQDPSDLLPKLIWEGKGYRYDMLETYGEEETALNFKFFYLIVSTMLATISQTLCIGVWVLRFPAGSNEVGRSLTISTFGIGLIILANAVAMSHYTKEEEKNCMIAHILLLVQTNAHIPIVWWIHRQWMSQSGELTSKLKIN